MGAVKEFHQLQALVWGGRLESITLPEPGSNRANIRFLTPEGCEKYLQATENGIEVPGKKDTFVFVARLEAPNSINDVIRNCIDGDVSRVVRVFDADDDWTDVALSSFARNRNGKREIDCIRRGNLANGVCDTVPVRFDD